MFNFAVPAIMSALVAGGIALSVWSDSDRIQPGSIVTLEDAPGQWKVVSKNGFTWELIPVSESKPGQRDVGVISKERHQINEVVGFQPVYR